LEQRIVWRCKKPHNHAERKSTLRSTQNEIRMIDALHSFLAVATAGSFSRVAKAQAVAVSSVTRKIDWLEAEIGVRLFHRSPRRVALTDAGVQFVQRARNILAELVEAKEAVTAVDAAEPRGLLTVTAPSVFGRRHVAPAVASFLKRHPLLEIDLHASDHVIDLAEQRIDVAIRIGVLPDSDLIATPLAPLRLLACASPDYIARHGRPASIDQLAHHNCLQYRLRGRTYDRWSFPLPEGAQVVQVSGNLVSDDADVVRRWGVAGEGIVYKSWLDVSADVAAGRLEVLLPRVPGEPTPLSLVCPHRKQFSPAVKLLHALIEERCRPLAQALARLG
jgi:DNA-binding transcriptional LysR family regulator